MAQPQYILRAIFVSDEYSFRIVTLCEWKKEYQILRARSARKEKKDRRNLAAIKCTWVNLEMFSAVFHLLLKCWITTRGERTDSQFEKMREQWKRAGDHRATTRIINHRSNAHFGRWTRQMWFKINIKNPFPLWNRVSSHILSVAEVMVPGVRACICVSIKSKFASIRENACKIILQFHALSPSSRSMSPNLQKTDYYI